METLIQIGELLGAAFAASWLTRILTIKARVKQEDMQAKKAEAEAKKEQINTVKQLVDEIYKPAIEDLKAQVGELRVEVQEVRQENERIKKENRLLKEENAQLRTAIRKIDPKLVPDRRGANAKGQNRSKDGKFSKKTDDVEA